MKRFLLMSLVVAAIAMIAGAQAFRAHAAPPRKDMSVVDLPDKTRVAKTVLQGKYIFVHDDEKMASALLLHLRVQRGCGGPTRSETRQAGRFVSLPARPAREGYAHSTDLWNGEPGFV